jgi:type IV secretory pathway VirB10-like protein
VHQILLLSREIAMPMPSLFKYFVTVGAALLGVLFLINYLLEQPAPAAAQNAAPAKSVVVKTDPQASRVERWRAEQAAAEAARKEEAARLAAQPAEPETAAQPVKAAATPAASAVSHTADASLTGTDAAAAEQSKLKSRKARAAEKARTKRLAREDARPGTARERTASNQQDDYYYGQRQGYAQRGYAQQGFAPAPAYAYAPQQSYGPFNGGWGRGW